MLTIKVIFICHPHLIHRLFNLQCHWATPKQENKLVEESFVRFCNFVQNMKADDPNQPENTVPFVASNIRNFKPDYLVEWKAPRAFWGLWHFLLESFSPIKLSHVLIFYYHILENVTLTNELTFDCNKENLAKVAPQRLGVTLNSANLMALWHCYWNFWQERSIMVETGYLNQTVSSLSDQMTWK